MTTRFDAIKQAIIKKTDTQKEKTRREYKEFFDHPLLYVALISSGLLSALAGLSIGLGVHMDGDVVIATLDVPHVFFAVLYCALFPYFFEFGLANWLHKFLHREPNNNVQFWTAGVMIAITFVGTAITAYAAMDVLVTAGGFFNSFTSISAGVQRWIAFSLPTMFMINILSGELYRQFTTEAILKRAALMELREEQTAADMEVNLAQMDAKKKIAIAQAEEYSRRAEQDAPGIGREKGASAWRNDAGQMRPTTTYAADVDAPKDQAGQNRNQNPPQD